MNCLMVILIWLQYQLWSLICVIHTYTDHESCTISDNVNNTTSADQLKDHENIVSWIYCNINSCIR